MATATRTRYVVSTNGVDLSDTYTSKTAALKTAEAYVWAAERSARRERSVTHEINVRTQRSGKIVFARVVTVPALPVPPAQSAVQTTVGPFLSSGVDTATRYTGSLLCGWCDQPSNWKINIPTMSHVDHACSEHFREYYPALNNAQHVSALCPNVEKGCSHTMVQNDQGYGIACAEYADALGIQWRKREPGVSAAIFLSAVRIARRTPSAKSITQA